MSAIKLSYEELESIASQLKNSSDAMAEILKSIEDEFSKVGDEGTWSGTAASETKVVFDSLSQKFPEFSEAVESCYIYLTTKVIPNYKAADAVITGKQDDLF